MKQFDWQALYGKETENFRQMVVNTLAEEQHETRRLSWPRKRFISIIVTAILLFAVTALATINHARLVNFFSKWQSRINNPVAVSIPQSQSEERIYLHETFDDLTVEITEALEVGTAHYFVTTVSMQPGKQGTVRSLDSLRVGAEQEPIPQGDALTYYVHQEIQHQTGGSDTFDYINNDDGSVSFFSDLTFFTMANDVHLFCNVQVIKALPGEVPLPILAPYNPDAEEVSFSFNLPMPKSIDARHSEGEIYFKEAGIRVDYIFLRQTEDKNTCAVYFHKDGGAPLTMESKESVRFVLLGLPDTNQMQEIPFELVRYHNGYYTAKAELPWDHIPQSIVLALMRDDKDGYMDPQEVMLVDGDINTNALLMYAPL